MSRAGNNRRSANYSFVKLYDEMPEDDLTIERALSFIPEPSRTCYRMMFEWFQENTGTIGRQLKRNDLPFPDESFTPYAQRGIHVPHGQTYAANITSRLGSIYSDTDQPLIDLPDGTWSLVYSAHRNNQGNDTLSRWNDGLMANMRDGVPVGVYIQASPNSSKYYRALAYVESYRPELDVFMLRGPVTALNAGAFASPLKQTALFDTAETPSAEELESEVRSYELVKTAVRHGQDAFRRKLLEAYEGRCAITTCDIPETLQAAHIIGHRGLATNTPSNGMLLRADIHLLYDHGLLSVEPDKLRVVVSSKLSNSEYSELEGRKLTIPSQRKFTPDSRYLAVKYREFQMIEKAS